MDNFYSEEGYNEMSGLAATDPTATTSTSTLPTWLQDVLSAGSQLATTAAQVTAAKQIAKTGQVPTAQVNVGVAPDTKKALIIGGTIALGLLGVWMFSRR